MNDDEPRPTPQRLTILPLDQLGIDELESYVADLRSEIVRAEAAIRKKRASRNQADAVFGRAHAGEGS